MTITVHHLNNSRSRRILWLLEELGADYELVTYQRDAETVRPNSSRFIRWASRRLSRMATPAISESGAIIQYLCERHGGANWLPAHDGEAHVRHLEWMQFGESFFFVPVMLKIYAGRLGDAAAR